MKGYSALIVLETLALLPPEYFCVHLYAPESG